MPTARAGLAAATFDNLIYAIAGEGVNGVLDVSERYNPETDAWEILAPKPIPVFNIQAGVIGDRIFLPGGELPDGKVTNALEIYDPRTDTWSVGAPLPVRLSGYSMVAFEGKLYLFGGWDGERYLDITLIYDPTQDSWYEGAPLSTPRAFAGAAISNGKIYVLGGYDGEKALVSSEAFTPSLDLVGAKPWASAFPLPENRFGMSVTSVLDNIYVMFGQQDESLPPTMSFIRGSIQNEEWENLSSDNIEAFRSAVSVVGTRIFVMGGEVNDFLSSNLVYQAVYTVVFPIVQ
jgi:N-acetylneuraminic acid mutarotase